MEEESVFSRARRCVSGGGGHSDALYVKKDVATERKIRGYRGKGGIYIPVHKVWRRQSCQEICSILSYMS